MLCKLCYAAWAGLNSIGMGWAGLGWLSAWLAGCWLTGWLPGSWLAGWLTAGVVGLAGWAGWQLGWLLRVHAVLQQSGIEKSDRNGTETRVHRDIIYASVLRILAGGGSEGCLRRSPPLVTHTNGTVA